MWFIIQGTSAHSPRNGELIDQTEQSRKSVYGLPGNSHLFNATAPVTNVYKELGSDFVVIGYVGRGTGRLWC